jgi:hypothetical protein
MSKLSSQFKSTVKRILKEEVEKSSTDKKIFKRLPELNKGTDLKDIIPHKVDSKSKEEILDVITKAAQGAEKSSTVVWDDHDDIMINVRDLNSIRITPRWSNSYNIEAFTKNEDRIVVVGQTLEQVLSFIKENLKNQETNTEKAYKKSVDNEKEKSIDAPDKGLNQKDKPSPKKVGDTSNKNKDFNEDLEKKHPQNTPFEEVGKLKKQDEHSVKGTKPTYKYPKQKDTKLTIKQK